MCATLVTRTLAKSSESLVSLVQTILSCETSFQVVGTRLAWLLLIKLEQPRRILDGRKMTGHGKSKRLPAYLLLRLSWQPERGRPEIPASSECLLWYRLDVPGRLPLGLPPSLHGRHGRGLSGIKATLASSSCLLPVPPTPISARTRWPGTSHWAATVVGGSAIKDRTAAMPELTSEWDESGWW